MGKEDRGSGHEHEAATCALCVERTEAESGSHAPTYRQEQRDTPLSEATAITVDRHIWGIKRFNLALSRDPKDGLKSQQPFDRKAPNTAKWHQHGVSNSISQLRERLYGPAPVQYSPVSYRTSGTSERLLV